MALVRIRSAFQTLTNNTACLHSVLVDLHKVVGQVTQLWFHALWRHLLYHQQQKLKRSFNLDILMGPQKNVNLFQVNHCFVSVITLVFLFSALYHSD